MQPKKHKRKTLVSLWLPIAVLLMGMVFFIFVVVEYQRNIALVEQNRTLIASGIKASLINRALSENNSRNWSKAQGNYNWIKSIPQTYWFNNQVQEFPWHKSQGNTHSQSWSELWAAINTQATEASVELNQQRLELLIAIQFALEISDEAKIKASFEAYLEHQNAYQLSPQEEITFSLKLVQIGAEDYWSPELIHTILVTGGSARTPLFRPVVDLLFRHAELFSEKEFKQILSQVKQNLELFNLSSYHLDSYFIHFNKPQFTLPQDIDSLSSNDDFFINGNWLIEKNSPKQLSARPFILKDELQFIQDEFISVGILVQGDSLVLHSKTATTPINQLNIGINKAQLNRDKRNQVFYLIFKSVMLIILIALILITLRLIERNQQRRSQYIELKEDFVKLVSHELKTPLAGIRAMAETLQKRVERGMGSQAYPERIINEADKLWYMVDNILGFNRVQLTDTIIDKQPTQIKQLCDGVTDDVRSFSNKPYSVNNRINDTIKIFVDSDLFSLVVKNIIVNAGLYNNKNTIEVDLSFDDKEYCLLIKDNGTGIAKEDWHKIFEPFVRLEQPVRQSGTGLGLAMCKRIMQLHNGNLRLAESDSNGSTWKISFKK